MPNKTLSLLIVGMCLFLSMSGQAYAKDVRTVEILVLNSYHKGLPWTDNIVSGIESVLVRENIDADLAIEYMDSKVVKYDKTYKAMLYKLYSHKYGHQRFDIIISSDDNAFNFLREYRKEIFPDTPIVFCGVNNLEAPTIINRDHFTGILEIGSQKETLDLALKIHPETKQVVIVTDTTSSGQYSWKQVEPFFIGYPDITFTRIDDRFSISEIEDRMKKLSDDTIAIYTSLYRDKTGRYISLSEGPSRISKSSRRPIYSFHTQVLQHGTIGGKLLGGLHHGEKTAEMAIRILQGEKVSNIPIVDQSVAQYIFDYQQLKRFGIKSSDLPNDSYIINKPASFYEQNKQVVWIISGAFSFLVTVAVILVLNIMRSRKAEQERLEREGKLRLLFDHSPVGICTVDLLGNFVTTNPAYEQMLGYSKEELRELSFFDVTHPDYRPKNKALFQNMFSLESTGFKIEKKYIRNDGDEIDVSVNATAVIDDEGKTKFGTAFVEDITERRKAEKELNLSNRRYQTLFQNSPIPLWEEDFTEVYQYLDTLREQGVRDFRKHSETDPSFLEKCSQKVKILDVNQEVLKLHGANTKKDILGNLNKIFTDKSFETFKEEIISLSKGAFNFESEGEVKTLSGEKKSIFIKMILNREQGDLTKALIATVDITNRKKMEDQIQQSQKMESIGNLAGGIAHDFNNLLFPIIGMSEMLLEDLPEDSLEYENANEIFHAGKRAGDLVKQILAFSRQSEHKMTPVRVQNVLKEVLKLCRSTIPSNIEIHEDIQQNCGLVMADSTQIHQISMNLITNAFHAVEEKNGTIDVKLKEITLKRNELPNSKLQPGQFIRLSISDNGIGMSQNTIFKIFEPYFTTKKQGKGTGLGLSVVYGIVKEHDGDIKVYSEMGKGTTFNIYLPLMKKSSKIAAVEQEAGMATGTENILLVDDEVSVANLVGQMLSRLGYQVTIKTNSVDALNTFKKTPEYFALVVSDMTMPNMTGDQLAVEILSIKPDTPIIICTGFSERINKVQAEIIGVKGFLMKPAVKADMAQLVRKVLDEAKNDTGLEE